jgi:hypothetical protein
MPDLDFPDQVPRDHELRWDAGAAFRWIQMGRGPSHWTDAERYAALKFLAVAEIGTLRDGDGVAAAVARYPHQLELARVSVWLVAKAVAVSPEPESLIAAALTPEPGPDASTAQRVNYRARTELLEFAAQLIHTLTVPIERMSECHPYCLVTESEMPCTLHTLAAVWFLVELYEERPLAFAAMRSLLTDSEGES